MTTHTWTPSDRDRLIYRWVKFDGHKQSWVADQLDLNQSTVSRIIDRYERWIAHGGPAQQGALNRDERLRAQLWLTRERNEWIIASAMRIAGEMEHMSDATKSTTTHHSSDPSCQIEVRTENSIRDRTATVCRYLRLAHRVGMDQVKLVEKYDLPDLEPFTLDPNELSQALADSRSGFQSNASPFVAAVDNTVPANNPGTPTQCVSEDEPASTSNQPDPASSSSFILQPSSLSPAPMPSTHNHAPPQPPLTPAPTITSLEISPHKKPIVHAYALPQTPPEPTAPLNPVLEATCHQPLPPIRILPLMTSIP